MKSKSMVPQWRTAMAAGSSPGRCPAIGAALFDTPAIAHQAVQAPRLDVRAKPIGLPNHGLAGAEHQPPVLGHRSGEPLKGERALFRAEVEQNVTAQDDVESARMRWRLKQIVDLQAKRPAQGFDRPPTVRRLLEPFDHLIDAKTALNLELGVG